MQRRRREATYLHDDVQCDKAWMSRRDKDRSSILVCFKMQGLKRLDHEVIVASAPAFRGSSLKIPASLLLRRSNSCYEEISGFKAIDH